MRVTPLGVNCILFRDRYHRRYDAVYLLSFILVAGESCAACHAVDVFSKSFATKRCRGPCSYFLVFGNSFDFIIVNFKVESTLSPILGTSIMDLICNSLLSLAELLCDAQASIHVKLS